MRRGPKLVAGAVAICLVSLLVFWLGITLHPPESMVP
jgi:hypothetical protein